MPGPYRALMEYSLPFQLLLQPGTRGDVDGGVHLVQDHAGLGAVGFPDVLHLGGIDRHLCTAVLAGMQHGQLGSLLSGRVGDVLSPAHDNAVAAGSLLHMEPQILAARGVQRQLIVLQIVAADQNLKAIA